MEQWTIKRLLEWVTYYLKEKAIESPRLCAELLLSHVLNLKRIELYTNFDRIVNKEQLAQLRGLVQRAANSEPIAYLTGGCDFYSLEFIIMPDCLIPRPETELLVERAIEFLKPRQGKQLICDLCTGSGCIAIAIAKNLPNVEIIATDISDSALKIAQQNTQKHNVSDKVKLIQGDLFEPLIPQLDKTKFDLVVCNPPYVSDLEYQNLQKNVKDYEPKSALLAGADGLDTYRRICESADKFLKDDAALMMEI
ncbi:MAG: peptide chain release factor N(5)-glutamine methyltransferase, partial [Sedimentisphaerales bacterium]|nr:peptide chain release factor N(5)-glutamine methyltransferase [Sedimentisphaerales bacterium]